MRVDLIVYVDYHVVINTHEKVFFNAFVEIHFPDIC